MDSGRVRPETSRQQLEPRLPRITPSQLNEGQRELYAVITAGPRAQGPQLFERVGPGGDLLGPFNAMLYSPDVGWATQALGTALTTATLMTSREREIAVLTVAARWQSEFQWYAHERLALHAGFSNAELDAVLVGREDTFTDSRERIVLRIARRSRRRSRRNCQQSAEATT